MVESHYHSKVMIIITRAFPTLVSHIVVSKQANIEKHHALIRFETHLLLAVESGFIPKDFWTQITEQQG